ncbi:MAG: hypothetical protein ACFFG0_23200 [Candidatus Thorarchaeota archaeon]
MASACKIGLRAMTRPASPIGIPASFRIRLIIWRKGITPNWQKKH